MFKSMGPIRYVSTVCWPSLTQITVLKWPFTDRQEIGGNHVNHGMAACVQKVARLPECRSNLEVLGLFGTRIIKPIKS